MSLNIQYNIAIVMLLVLLGGMVFKCSNVLDIPIVRFEYPTNACVEVISSNKEHSCENLPEKFHHEWTVSNF